MALGNAVPVDETMMVDGISSPAPLATSSFMTPTMVRTAIKVTKLSSSPAPPGLQIHLPPPFLLTTSTEHQTTPPWNR